METFSKEQQEIFNKYFNGNLVDKTSNFIIYELSNNPIQGGVPLQTSNWNQFNLNTNLSPFQCYWLGGINTNLPQIFTNKSELQTAVNSWTNNPIPAVNIFGLIENWNVGNVTNMSNMFDHATSFNQDLNNWNVGNVTSMSNMFSGATSFNQDISNWNVGNVISMNSMFKGATSFNQNISNWNVGNVLNMSNMFLGANTFNQDISNWNVENITNTNLVGMFENVTHFTAMTDKIYANGTPYNYFISQKNPSIGVVISQYSIIKYGGDKYAAARPLLVLTDASNAGVNSDFNLIKNALSITSMDDLVNYSFITWDDSTSRDIISVHEVGDNTLQYKLSGDIVNNQIYPASTGPWALAFTRRT